MPEEKIYLKTNLSDIFRIQESQKIGLHKLGIKTVSDLLFYFPVRYQSSAEISYIDRLQKGDKVVLFGKITNLETGKAYLKKIPLAKATLEDETGSIDIVWFHQAFIAKTLTPNSFVKIDGVVGERNGKLYLSNPKAEKIGELPFGVGNSLFGKAEEESLYPIYKETKGLTSLWIFHTIQKLIKKGVLENVDDYLPQETLTNYHLPALKTALIWIHTPRNQNDKEAARKRFAFEEIFLLQLKNKKEKQQLGLLKAPSIKNRTASVEVFKERFKFDFTEGQATAITTVLRDFEKGVPMSRLLNGDVGSGKTAVAATTAFCVVSEERVVQKKTTEAILKKGKEIDKSLGHLQVAYMAPTEILANQHFNSFKEYFKDLHIPIGLLTGTTCKKFPSKSNPKEATVISKNQLLKWVATGEIGILIGTHALIQKKVIFNNLAYVIIDEQHRFGTKQRKTLARKDGSVPHLLSMTATPIPRTLALTIYGNLDLSVLEEMPRGRKPILTSIVLPQHRKETYGKIRAELQLGRQVYVICPRINEPDPEKEKALAVKSVVEESKKLQKEIFPEYKIGILHSKMSPKEKDEVMASFVKHETDILVATSVIEVGVNVPNATVIVIEGAERFGLSQLHQLRGRVIRGNHQAHCFVFAEGRSEKTIERLRAFRDAKNGFELSEMDLRLRGAGELSGDVQWGISDIGMEAIKNLKLVELAKEEAEKIITMDPELKNLPLLREVLLQKEAVHFE